MLAASGARSETGDYPGPGVWYPSLYLISNQRKPAKVEFPVEFELEAVGDPQPDASPEPTPAKATPGADAGGRARRRDLGGRDRRDRPGRAARGPGRRRARRAPRLTWTRTSSAGSSRRQFPQWAGLPVTPVVPGGHDHRTFRLGDELSVRLPSAEGYAQQVAKEQRWLPVLAPRLPLAIPAPSPTACPARAIRIEWSVYRWLEGEPATAATIADPVALAVELAGFLRALGAVDAAGGPPPGPHNFHRGGPVARLRRRDAAGDRGPRRPDPARGGRCACGRRAVDVEWHGEPVWFHGDVAEGNLLLRDGRLSAVIDFGTVGVGDPACDLVIAWTSCAARARTAFRVGAGRRRRDVGARARVGAVEGADHRPTTRPRRPRSNNCSGREGEGSPRRRALT